MSETSPNPTTPPPSQPSTGPVLPPIDPKALIATALAVVKNPTEFFKGKKGETGYVNCLVFSVAAAAVYGVLAFLSTFLWTLPAGFGWAISAAFKALILGIILGGIVGPFLGGLIVWGVSLIFGSKAPYEPSVRIAGYSAAVLPAMGVATFLSIVPWLGGLVLLAVGAYGIYIAVMGARVINFDAPPAPTPTT